MRPAETASRRRPVLDFMKTAIGAYGHTGTLFPSSRYATRAIAARLPSTCGVVVEYGAGNGLLSAGLLAALGAEGRLVGVEIVDRFVEELRKLDDRRLTVVHGDVFETARRLREWAPGGVDAVVSGVPLSFFGPQKTEELVRLTRAGLRPGGRFVVYQNSPIAMPTLRRHFASVRLAIEPRNLPPYFLMTAEV